ncbi:MAG: hypothetical protein A2508_01955 [Candidatus Lambdaproteobacteria bacterium RIFOXYD12_FULL_49_8]|nr:MAG: hypothetical protein A2508_01955 [Candidatus Lambdaproteobacteria bacterium RIFOXYD12_FULL_49_8]
MLIQRKLKWTPSSSFESAKVEAASSKDSCLVPTKEPSQSFGEIKDLSTLKLKCRQLCRGLSLIRTRFAQIKLDPPAKPKVGLIFRWWLIGQTQKHPSF